MDKYIEKKIDDKLIRTIEHSASSNAMAMVSRHMMWVLVGTIVAGTFIMGLSLWIPMYVVEKLPANQTLTTEDLRTGTFTNAAKEVLPFATGLIGFAGGLSAALFGRTTQSEKS